MKLTRSKKEFFPPLPNINPQIYAYELDRTGIILCDGI
jgi:hypothetical protein